MSVTNPGDLRRRIDAKRRQALMLLSVASHDTVNEQVRLGLRDLDEALAWLHRKPSTSPVHLLIDLAAWRLSTAMQMLRTQDPEEEGQNQHDPACPW
jgi:hypothetical protein